MHPAGCAAWWRQNLQLSLLLPPSLTLPVWQIVIHREMVAGWAGRRGRVIWVDGARSFHRSDLPFLCGQQIAMPCKPWSSPIEHRVGMLGKAP